MCHLSCEISGENMMYLWYKISPSVNFILCVLLFKCMQVPNRKHRENVHMYISTDAIKESALFTLLISVLHFHSETKYKK